MKSVNDANTLSPLSIRKALQISNTAVLILYRHTSHYKDRSLTRKYNQILVGGDATYRVEGSYNMLILVQHLTAAMSTTTRTAGVIRILKNNSNGKVKYTTIHSNDSSEEEDTAINPMEEDSAPGHFRSSTRCNIHPINVGQWCQGDQNAKLAQNTPGLSLSAHKRNWLKQLFIDSTGNSKANEKLTDEFLSGTAYI